MTHSFAWPRLPLPEHLKQPAGVYWTPSEPFLAELAENLQGKRVLEIFSGNGFLAAQLQQRGIPVRPTTVFTGHDAHERGLYCEVEELEARLAVITYRAVADVLLVCWPTVTNAVLQAVQLWGSQKPVAFIGEVTDYSRHILGGCATDEFFEAIDVEHRFHNYRGNMAEAAFLCRLKSG